MRRHAACLSQPVTRSVSVPEVELPEAAVGIAIGLLTQLALRRHGSAAVLRALSRAERAPAFIAAF
jgi:hypothetical protein